MKAFRDLSIRGKLIVTMVAVTTIALACGFTLVIIADITSVKQDMVDRTTTTARGIGDYCVTPLAFEDSEGAAGMLTRLDAIPSITNAAVYDADGDLFAALDPETVPDVHRARPIASSPGISFTSTSRSSTRAITTASSICRHPPIHCTRRSSATCCTWLP